MESSSISIIKTFSVLGTGVHLIYALIIFFLFLVAAIRFGKLSFGLLALTALFEAFTALPFWVQGFLPQGDNGMLMVFGGSFLIRTLSMLIGLVGSHSLGDRLRTSVLAKQRIRDNGTPVRHTI